MFWTIVTGVFAALGLLAMFWAHSDSKHAHFMDRHG